MATTYLTRTQTAGNQTTWTLSAWFKRNQLSVSHIMPWCAGTYSSTNAVQIYFPATDELTCHGYDSGGTLLFDVSTNRKFRDTNAYYHMVIACDTTQAVAADRFKIYINGVQETNLLTSSYPAEDLNTAFNQDTVPLVIGNRNGASYYFDGLMSHIQLVDGLQLAPTEFGEVDATSGIWKIKTACYATPGTNGFCLKMETTTGSAMGTDSSGEGNNFTVGAGTPTQTVDNPSNVMGTMNPLQLYGSPLTFANGNTKATRVGSWRGVMGSLGITKGKWYYEMKKVSGNVALGMGKYGSAVDDSVYLSTSTAWLGDKAGAWIFYNNAGGNIRYGNGSGGDSYGSAPSDGDILMCAMDLDNGTIWVGKEGTWFDSATQGEIEAGTTTNSMYSGITIDGPFSPIFGIEGVVECNFGNGYFATTQVSSAGTSSTDDDSIWEFDCPDGYYGLNTKNINTYG